MFSRRLPISPDAVAITVEVVGGLYLDAPKARSRIHDEIVAAAVAPGLGHVQAEAGGFVDKCQLCQFTLLFGVSLAAQTAGAGLWLGLVSDPRLVFHVSKEKGASQSLRLFLTFYFQSSRLEEENGTWVEKLFGH